MQPSPQPLKDGKVIHYISAGDPLCCIVPGFASDDTVHMAGKVVLVTGATSGFGLSISRKFAAAGNLLVRLSIAWDRN